MNPVLGAMIYAFGGDMLGSSIAKVIIFSCLLSIYLSDAVKHRWAIPVLLSLVGACLVINNIVAYLGL